MKTKLKYIGMIAVSALLLNSCAVYDYPMYTSASVGVGGHGWSSSVSWTNASYDVNGFPIYGYSYGRPVYGYTPAGVAIFSIAAITAACLVPDWGPAPWYHGHWHYPAHVHRVCAPPRHPAGHHPGVRPPHHGGGHHAVARPHGGKHHRPSARPHGHSSSRPAINHAPGHLNKPGAHHSRPNVQPHRPQVAARPNGKLNRPQTNHRPQMGTRPQVHQSCPQFSSRPQMTSRTHSGFRSHGGNRGAHGGRGGHGGHRR